MPSQTYLLDWIKTPVYHFFPTSRSRGYNRFQGKLRRYWKCGREDIATISVNAIYAPKTRGTHETQCWQPPITQSYKSRTDLRAPKHETVKAAVTSRSPHRDGSTSSCWVGKNIGRTLSTSTGAFENKRVYRKGDMQLVPIKRTTLPAHI